MLSPKLIIRETDNNIRFLNIVIELLSSCCYCFYVIVAAAAADVACCSCCYMCMAMCLSSSFVTRYCIMAFLEILWFTDLFNSLQFSTHVSTQLKNLYRNAMSTKRRNTVKLLSKVYMCKKN